VRFGDNLAAFLLNEATGLVEYVDGLSRRDWRVRLVSWMEWCERVVAGA